VLRVLIMLALLFAVIYLTVRLVRGKGEGGTSWRPKRPSAPDDDPTFLRELDEKVWRERHQKKDPEGGETPTPS